jgi:hypothetical protein
LFDQNVVFAHPASPWQRGTNKPERAAAPVPPQQTGLRRYGRDGDELANWPRSSQREQSTPMRRSSLRYRPTAVTTRLYDPAD